MTDCCEKCRFWESSMVFSNDGIGVRVPRYGTGTEEVIAGSCRRRSPQTFFPTTHQFQWCGEFEMREDVKPCMKCGKPSGVDGMGVMENYVIVGRVCKACSEKDKPKACVVCEGLLGPGWIPVDDIDHGISGGVCKECQDEVIAVIRSAKSGNKKEKPEPKPCVNCGKPCDGLEIFNSMAHGPFCGNCAHLTY